MPRRSRYCWLLLALLTFKVFAGSTPVRYPNINGLGREGLGYRALELALRKSGEPYSPQLVLGSNTANNDRIRHMLEKDEVDVVDFGTSPEFEQRYAAVYFPIDRGLNGWRLLLIRQQDRSRFEQVQSLAQLAHFTAGQGQGWPDTEILRNAGLPVVTLPILQNLFPTLAAARFDYVPLGVNEIYGLLQKYGEKEQHLAVDRHLLLIYPFGRLFFVRKGDTKLRNAIQKGLERAFDDGSFQAMLLSDPDYASAVNDPDLHKRLVLHLDNPTLSADFRRIPERYFFR